MRLLHLKTIKTIATNQELDFSKSTSSRKQVLSHAWSEVFKFIRTKQKHPKMFIQNEYQLGLYLKYVYNYSILAGNSFKIEVLEKYKESNKDLYGAFYSEHDYKFIESELEEYFDDMYLFSDCNSLYYKGLNVFKIIYPDNWRKYIPVESHREIFRQLTKTLNR